ncbi:MAG: hypothetical protein ACREKS_23350 [Candidatus Rokuibacteriota bacterium]
MRLNSFAWVPFMGVAAARPITQALVALGGLYGLYGLGAAVGLRRRTTARMVASARPV